MRIALVSDVHGNYPALISVIEDAVANNVDRFILVGDYIFDLPFSNEVVELLMKLENAHIVKGNKEDYLSILKNDNQVNRTIKQLNSLYQTFLNLPSAYYDYLIGLDGECYMELNPSLSLYAIHCPKAFNPWPKTPSLSSSYFYKRFLEEPFTHERFLEDFNDALNHDEIKGPISQIDANIIVFGHNHLQAYGFCGDKLIINPGSCGQPCDFSTTAPYTILEVMGNELDVRAAL